MTNHEILLIKLIGELFCISTYLDCDLLEHYGAKYLQTHIQVVLIAANPR